MFGFNASVHFLSYLMKLLDSIIKASVFTLIFFEAIEVPYIPPSLPPSPLSYLPLASLILSVVIYTVAFYIISYTFTVLSVIYFIA